MLKEKFKPYNILLASQSPRRYELLKGLDLDFKVVSVDCAEDYPHSISLENIPVFLAEKKADAYQGLKENEILITADTLVFLEGKVLGKPQNLEEAFDMIKSLSGKTHQVITGVCIRSLQQNKSFYKISEVSFENINAEEIHYYIQNHEVLDKAGAYGIQDWLGFTKISNIKGCYYNIMGLPLQGLYQALLEF